MWKVEVRLLAHYSEDPNLIAAFVGEAKEGGEDFFQRLARKWRKLPDYKPVLDTDRSAVKALCYAIIYGAGIETQFLTGYFGNTSSLTRLNAHNTW